MMNCINIWLIMRFIMVMLVSNGGHPRILVYDGYIMMVNTWCKIVTNKMKDG